MINEGTEIEEKLFEKLRQIEKRRQKFMKENDIKKATECHKEWEDAMRALMLQKGPDISFVEKEFKGGINVDRKGNIIEIE